MSEAEGREVHITFADGVRDDVARLAAQSASDDQTHKSEVESLKRRIAELLVECKANPYIGELMGPGVILSWPTVGGYASTYPLTRASHAFDSSIATSRPTAPPPSAAG
jgi:hypothetical protein